ncbi:MAG: transcriptional regulator NrdR [Chloroflexi bacterium]|nr:transcriptional regulator NrdR [Chloroflexota bacterium]
MACQRWQVCWSSGEYNTLRALLEQAAKENQLRCPYCSFADTQVIDSRESDDGAVIRRRRKCPQCNGRFTTYERAEAAQFMVVKKDGRREPFSRDKLTRNTLKALEKRPVPQELVERFLQRVEQRLYELGKSEVSSREIGQLVLEGLKELDPVAYVRFASVYMGVSDLEALQQVIHQLMVQQQSYAHPSTRRDSG